MSRLVAVELRRLSARRQVRVLLLLGLLGIVFGGVLQIVRTPTAEDADADLARARAAFLDMCVHDSVQFGQVPEGEARRICEEQAQFVSVSEGGFELVDLWDGNGGLVVAPLMVLIFASIAVGASFTGAEWKAGTVATLLVWEPRRPRVLAAKLVALAIGVFVAGVVLLALFCVAMVPAAAIKTTTAGADGEWLADLVVVILRGTGLAMLVSVVAASIAMIGRNTSAAVGAALVYLIVVENMVRGWFPELKRWLLVENASVLLLDDPSIVDFERSAAMAGLTLTLYGLALALVAGALFRARDIAGSS